MLDAKPQQEVARCQASARSCSMTSLNIGCSMISLNWACEGYQYAKLETPKYVRYILFMILFTSWRFRLRIYTTTWQARALWPASCRWPPVEWEIESKAWRELYYDARGFRWYRSYCGVSWADGETSSPGAKGGESSCRAVPRRILFLLILL